MPLKIRPGKQRRSQSGTPGEGAGRFVQLHAPRAVALRAGGLILFLALAAAIVGFWFGRRDGLPLTIEPARELAVGKPRVYEAKAGPWGEIICQRSVMELPPEHLPVRFYESDKPRWFFQGFSLQHLRQLLATADCSETQTSALLDSNGRLLDERGISLEPRDDIVLALSPKSRKQIYAVLARFKENKTQCDPFHWPADDEESLFAGANISKATRAVFERLCYRHGNVLLFADLQVLLRSLSDADQRAALVKVLSRRSVVFASLKVSPSTDITGLMKYWGVPGAERETLPVLQAAASLSPSREVSLAALLPPGVRALLFTFPLPGSGPQPNCHWTAFNFFKSRPDPPTTDDAFWLAKLKTDYVPVSGQPRYGDILSLEREGEIVHTCVYVADELVYTKNGVSHWAPWQLTIIPDLLGFYSWDLKPDQPLKMQYHRRKENGPPDT